MSFKWVVPAVLVSCGVVISTVIAQLATPAVAPPTIQTSDTVESTPATTPGPAAQAVAPPSPKVNVLSFSEPQMVVMRLRNADAAMVSEMLSTLLANDGPQSVRQTVDPRSNSLILHGRKDEVDRVRKLVEQLDSESEAKLGIDLPKPARIAAPRVRSSPGPNAAWPVPNNPYVSAPRIPTAADVKLMQDYASLENQSLEAAKAYRKGMESLGENHPQQQERREQIASLVEKSFDVRQELQNQELKQLKDRMAKVEQLLGKRAQNRSEIIGRRIKEMVDEDRDLEWNASTAPAIPPGYAHGFVSSQPTVIPRTITGSDGNTVTVYETVPPTTQAQINPVPIFPTYPRNPAVTNSPAGVSSQNIPSIDQPVPSAASGTPSIRYDFIPNAQPATAGPFAQPVGGEQRRALGSANELVLRKEAEVAGWKKKLGDAGLQENAEFQTVLRELQAAKRQLDNAKRESEAILTLLQLDVDAAKAEYEAAAGEFDRKTTIKKNTISGVSDEELSRSRGALQQAEIRVNRANVLFQLHQDAVKSEQAAAEATEPATSAPEKAAPAGASRR